MTLTAPPQQSLTEVAASPVRPGRRPRKRSSAGGSRTLISSVDLNRHRVAYVVAITVTMCRSAATSGQRNGTPSLA